MGKFFGTDGVRGKANTELTIELAIKIAKAAATLLVAEKTKQPLVLIGKDTRLSSDMLEAALVSGFTSLGVNVQLIGVVPTPAIAYLVTKSNAVAGVMISASHNPYEDNGIKLFNKDGNKLPDSVENELELLIENENYKTPSSKRLGRVELNYSAVDEYITHIASTVKGDFSNYRVVVDCANGSSSTTARKLFNKLNIDTQILCASPNGININERCGSTHMGEFCSYVKNGAFDIGFSFDGDADRCIAVNSDGSIIDGDMMLAVFSKYLSEKGLLKNNTVVVTVMTNMGFFEYCKNNQINSEITRVGDRYILESMIANGFNLGGEQSGHIIFKDYANTGDGQLAAIQFLNIMCDTQKNATELLEIIDIYPQVLVNIKIENDKKVLLDTDKVILEAIAKVEKKLENSGRIMVRASGTEPLARVMIEGKDFNAIKQLANEVADTIKERLCV